MIMFSEKGPPIDSNTVFVFTVDTTGAEVGTTPEGLSLKENFFAVFKEYEKDILKADVFPGYSSVYRCGSFDVALLCIAEKTYGDNKDKSADIEDALLSAIDDLMDTYKEELNVRKFVSGILGRRHKVMKSGYDYLKEKYSHVEWYFKPKGKV